MKMKIIDKEIMKTFAEIEKNYRFSSDEVLLSQREMQKIVQQVAKKRNRIGQ